MMMTTTMTRNCQVQLRVIRQDCKSLQGKGEPKKSLSFRLVLLAKKNKCSNNRSSLPTKLVATPVAVASATRVASPVSKKHRCPRTILYTSNL